LITEDGPKGPISIAEITATGLRLPRVVPLQGRPLLEADAGPGATRVVVIGFNVWQSRFSADPAIVGKRVQLSGIFHTVVGVMPEGFAFPVNHSYWTPLGADAVSGRLTQDTSVFVFARLASGATIETRIRGRDDGTAADETLFPGQPLRARVVPYTVGVIGGSDLWLHHVVFHRRCC
jgi:hypothetical protein